MSPWNAVAARVESISAIAEASAPKLEKCWPYWKRTRGNQGCSPVDLREFLVSRKYSIYGFDRTTGLVAPAGVYSENMVGVPDDRPLPGTVHWPWPLDSMGA